MLFFKRILDIRKTDLAPNRRGAPRYAITPRFPLKVILNAVGRDELGHPLQARDGAGWDWSGRLVDLSFTGARMQVPPTVCAQRGDACQLKFDLEGFQLAIPGHIAHIAERRDSFLYGLALEPGDAAPGQAYQQLIELVALGATLKPTQPARPDPSGYLVEQYAGEERSRLDVWREQAGGTVAAFDFHLNDCRVRGLAHQANLEYLIAADAGPAQPAPPTQSEEIHRLFHWVVPNIAPAVPADVRDFLQKFAA